MSSDKRATWNRKAFYRHRPLSSEKEGCASGMGTLSTIRESSSPKPCPGSPTSSTCFLTNDQIKMLKEGIKDDLQRFILEILTELKKKQKGANTYCKCVADPSTLETLDRADRAKCKTGTCIDIETHGCLRDVTESNHGCEKQDILIQSETEVTEENGNDLSGTRRTDHRENNNVSADPTLTRSSSLKYRVKSVAVLPRPRSLIIIPKAQYDERECLANALQFHIQDLVDGVVFQDSELPDGLIGEGCLTEDECASVSHHRDRKDQIRILTSLIKGRDLRVLKGFLKNIRMQNPGVASKINETFEINKKNGVRGKVCALCKMIEELNVKQVADSLWSIQVISTELYQRIVCSESSQTELWKEVICSLSILDREKAELAQTKIINVISSKNLYTHLAEGVRSIQAKNHGKLICICEQNPVLRPFSFLSRADTSSESVLPDSNSDYSSNDMTSNGGTETGDVLYQRERNTVEGMTKVTGVCVATNDPTTLPKQVLEKMRTMNNASNNRSQILDLNQRSNDDPKRENNTTMESVIKEDVPQRPLKSLKPPLPKKPDYLKQLFKKTLPGKKA